MEEGKTLDCLAVGRQATVAALSAPEAQRRRMLELGLDPNQKAEKSHYYAGAPKSEAKRS